MFWIELIIVLAIIFIGVRVGGTFLAMAGGIGMFIMTFILHVTPSDPPITVILIMIAVICAAATMQACGGLDYLVRIAEKILRKNPKMITVLAPVVAYIFTFMCGTGHIVYSLLPVINEIAIETGVRPERPISASIVSSQQAITACPISAATVGILAFMAEATNYTKVNIFTLLIVCVPATLIGTVIAAIAVIKKGKELADDPEFQARVEAGLIEDFSKKVKEEKKVSKEAKISVTIFLIAMVGIVLLGAVSGLVPTLADGSKLPLTTVIEIFMLVAAAAMILLTKLDSKTITLKGKAPSIEKEADKTTVEIGQVVTYTITGTIPDTTGYAQYTYKIHDTLTEGLDFVEDTMGKLPTEKKYEVSVQIEGEQDSVIKEADIDPDNARKMTLDLSQWIRENQTHKGKTFTVTYYAKVNADAVVQTNNSAHLEYGNDPDNITTTTPDVVTTPTYPVQIHKLIKDQQNSYLAGAIFRLYRSEEDANNNQNAIAVTGSNGTYTVDPEQVGDNKMYDMESIGDGTTVGTGMNLKLNGLAEGSYWLVETQAPDGYNKLTAPVKITITKSDTTNVNDWTIKQNDGVVDDKIIDIENTTGTLLPETGGMGTVIFTVIAVVMILGIAVSFVISRRKRA